MVGRWLPLLRLLRQVPLSRRIICIVGQSSRHPTRSLWLAPTLRDCKVMEGARTCTTPHCKLLIFCARSTSPNFSPLFLIDPPLPSQCGYFSAHSTEDIAGLHIRRSLDAFAVFFAYVSFLAAVSQFTGQETETPTWLLHLENPDSKQTDSIHPKFLNMFKKSHIVDFSGEQTRTGTIIDVLRCGWICVSEILLKANVPMWFY